MAAPFQFLGDKVVIQNFIRDSLSDPHYDDNKRDEWGARNIYAPIHDFAGGAS
jgi:hypothetical protein